MAGSQYSFSSRWRVESTLEEVYAIMEDTPDYVRWWPAVWLRVEVADPGDAQGIGKVFHLTSKGWLPYILQWTSRTVEKVFPTRLRLKASGDFEGEGCWNFQADGPMVNLDYEWRIEARKPLLRYLSFLLRPIFAANHKWAMARGEESLKLELARRHAITAQQRATLPSPPGPVFLSRKRRRRLGLDADRI